MQPITGHTDTPQPSTQTRNTGSKWPLWGGERVGPSPVGPGAGGAFRWEWGEAQAVDSGPSPAVSWPTTLRGHLSSKPHVHVRTRWRR